MDASSVVKASAVDGGRFSRSRDMMMIGILWDYFFGRYITIVFLGEVRTIIQKR